MESLDEDPIVNERLARRTKVRAGITKNHNRGTSKAKRRMAAASRRRNRK
jgi:hypothetical protein